MKHRKRWRDNNVVSRMIHKIQRRAKDKGLECEIEIQDITIPLVCPVLGIPIVVGHKNRDHWPSMDRVSCQFGYVRGNIQVISYRANRIKNNGTAEEHEKIAAWMRTTDNSHLLD
jgi:hypothetical protein